MGCHIQRSKESEAYSSHSTNVSFHTKVATMCQLVKQLAVFPLNYSTSMVRWLLLGSMFGE